ncbi:hypothetical protein LYNGBM3L_60610 [Moorena producens 3L]|uniref:Uncharacterized protein n=1 Tax=Moorena producens 3L TaxID=489825 RepID=F4Y0B8_9CYAN|nr:hypothetical protein LYNGBM3L_60610 [Moorena producens 3L]OLT65237.1 hypothetical protein BI334_09470 [Moorena producens 3L]
MALLYHKRLWKPVFNPSNSNPDQSPMVQPPESSNLSLLSSTFSQEVFKLDERLPVLMARVWVKPANFSVTQSDLRWDSNNCLSLKTT